MLQHITLHLARTQGYPEGSAQHGYEITAPIGPDGRLDADEWQAKRNLCRVRRFWRGENDQHGVLRHRSGGAGGATWVIDYDQDQSDDDETGYRLDAHTFEVGGYVSIRDAEGVLRTFKVADCRPVAIGVPRARTAAV